MMSARTGSRRDTIAADLDAECSACLMGARRLGELFARYGARGWRRRVARGRKAG